MILLFKGVMFGCHVSFQNVTLISRQGMSERVPGTNGFKEKTVAKNGLDTAVGIPKSSK